jgi:uncharacterized lipoprotein
MEKKNFVVGLVLIVLLAGCSLASSPKAAVQKFYKAVEKNDIKAMADVATPETVQLMAMFGTKVQGMLAANPNGKVNSVTEAIDGDTAVVTVTFENGEETNIDLVKIDGKWKVSMSMDK